MDANYTLTSNDALTRLAKENGINSWNDLTDFIKNIPYGRNQNRLDLSLVFTENKGTCSSKHALLKTIADANKIPNVLLIIGIYKMTQLNTPKIGLVLSNNAIDFIPEAHCYVKIDGTRVDLTAKESEFKKIEKDIIEELEILPHQVGEFKLNYHREFLKRWLKESKLNIPFKTLWHLREECIDNLSS